MKQSKRISAKEFDKKFDRGEDITEHLDLSTAVRGEGFEISRVNLDMPQWMIQGLDAEAQRLGISRQAIMKVWLGERLTSKV